MTMYVTDHEAKAILANLDSIFNMQSRRDKEIAVEHVKTLREYCAKSEKLKNRSLTAIMLSVLEGTHAFGEEAHIISFYINKLGYAS